MRAVRFFDRALSLTLVLASRWIKSTRAGRIQCGEHDGGFVGAQENHQLEMKRPPLFDHLQIRFPVRA
jgi:hypothetical protein